MKYIKNYPKHRYLAMLSVLAFVGLSCSALMAKDAVDYVDPFIGTGHMGKDFPVATVPFSMVKLSPDEGGNISYRYGGKFIQGFSFTHLGGADGTRARGEGADGEHAGDRAEDALRGRGQGEEFGGAGLGEQGLKLGGTGRGLGAEGGHQPATAGGEGFGTAMGAAVAGCAGFWETAGGEAGHQALEAAGGAIDAGPERNDESGETGLAQETPGDQGGEGGEDEADPAGEVGGEGLDRGRGGGDAHEYIPSTKRGAGARE